ncbi:MAG: DeoR/GlpR family DNA-binding transcription regulator [Actinomycetes bacterium]
MDSKTRRDTIAKQLSDQGEAYIVQLAERFGTSEMTIRRDLDLLEFEGHARRIRGGAISVQSRAFEPPILQRAANSADAKQRIGQAAAALLRENETVVIDGGTTTHQMAKAISDDFALTVITSSLLIATELSSKTKLETIVTGGTVRSGEMSLIGPRAVDSYRDLNCDALFLGVAGVSPEKGLTEYNLDDAYIKKAAIDSVRRVIVLADATKLAHVAFVNVAPIQRVDLLITNAAPENEIVLALKAQGIEVLHVEPFFQS